ncbi:MAG: PIG-L deacetylase family protein [Solirubrobacteraceae bacterium]
MLVIAAHPDDEVLGAGGTIARLAKQRQEVYIAILGEGMTARSESRATTDREQLTSLKSDSARAAERLGAADLFLHDLPDNRFDSVPLLDVVKIVEALVERIAPDTIYTHHAGDLNIDHTVTNRAVMAATRPTGDGVVSTVYAFEVPSSTEWSFGQVAPPFRPSVFVDIADTIDAKVEAMELYTSERRPFPHPRSPEALRALSSVRGAAAGLEAAEAFELARAIIR